MEFYDVYFLNPSKTFFHKITDYLTLSGFSKSCLTDTSAKFIKGQKEVSAELMEDYCGYFIIVILINVNGEELKKILSKCPVCGSNNLNPFIPGSWGNELTDMLSKEGKLGYYPGAYDRPGTRYQTRKCNKCGFEWFNETDFKYWSNRRKKLTLEDLGLMN